MVGIQYTEITNLAGSETEGVWANIQCDKQLLALGVMYRPPSSNNAYLKSMLNRIDNVFSYHENILLTIINSTSIFVPITYTHCNIYGMRQLINYSTRVTLTTYTVIDVIFSTEHESHIVTGVYHISLIDHYMQ